MDGFYNLVILFWTALRRALSGSESKEASTHHRESSQAQWQVRPETELPCRGQSQAEREVQDQDLRITQSPQGCVFPASVRSRLCCPWLSPAVLFANYGLAGRSQEESQQTPSRQLIVERFVHRRLNSYSIVSSLTHMHLTYLLSIYYV